MSRPAVMYSLFGQIEEVVARAMAEEGKAALLPYFAEATPEHLRVNEKGENVRLIVSVKGLHVGEFERRIAELRP